MENSCVIRGMRNSTSTRTKDLIKDLSESEVKKRLSKLAD